MNWQDSLLMPSGKKSRKSDGKGGDAQLAELSNEMQTLRARLAVDEAKGVPYSSRGIGAVPGDSAETKYS